MATLADRISELATAVRDKINIMVPRLIPAGGTVGQVLTKNGAGDYAAGWQDPGAGTFHPRGVHAKEVGLAAGGYVTQGINATALATAASAANRFYLIPFIPSRSITVDELAIEVTTLAAGSARIGIYSSTAAGAPDALLTGTAAVLDTGTIGLKNQAVAPVTLAAGTVYFLAVWTSAAPTLRTIAQGGLMILQNGAAANQLYTHFVSTVAFGALPAAAPAARTLTLGALPWTRLRLA